MTFADELKAWRSRRGVTQEEAAKLLHVPRRTYEGWECGDHEPARVELVRKVIARFDRHT